MPVTTLLFDADMLIYNALQNAEHEVHWDNNLYTLHCDFNEAKVNLESHLIELCQLVLAHWNTGGRYKIKMALTSMEGNFRKTIDENYKANRKTKRRPLAYIPMREWVKENFEVLMIENLEADDCIGLNADKNSIIISGDKDFRSIPCRFYDYLRNEYYDTTLKEADYYHLYQTLIGDTADNYKGCPKVGEVNAKRILDKEATWEAVVNAYEKNGATEEDALRNARLAFILRKGYYNKKTGKVKLWTP